MAVCCIWRGIVMTVSELCEPFGHKGSVKWCRSMEKFALCHKHCKYIYGTNTSVFTITSAINWAKFCLSSAIFTEVHSFGYAVYISADLHCRQFTLPALQGSGRINNIHNQLTLPIMVRESCTFGSFDCGDDGEDVGVGFIDITAIFSTEE